MAWEENQLRFRLLMEMHTQDFCFPAGMVLKSTHVQYEGNVIMGLAFQAGEGEDGSMILAYLICTPFTVKILPDDEQRKRNPFTGVSPDSVHRFNGTRPL